MYCNGEQPRTDNEDDVGYWLQADMHVQGILLSNMESHIIMDLERDITAEKLWTEVQQLFTGQMMADYTLTMANLLNMKFSGGDQDILEHIKTMKRF